MVALAFDPNIDNRMSSYINEYEERIMKIVRESLKKHPNLCKELKIERYRQLKRRLAYSINQSMIYSWHQKGLSIFQLESKKRVKFEFEDSDYVTHPIVVKVNSQLFLLGGELPAPFNRRVSSSRFYSIGYNYPHKIRRLPDFPGKKSIDLVATLLQEAIYIFEVDTLWKYSIKSNKWYKLPSIDLSYTNGNNLAHVLYDRYLILIVFSSFGFNEAAVWRLDLCAEEDGWTLVAKEIELNVNAKGIKNPLWSRMYGKYYLGNERISALLGSKILPRVLTNFNEVTSVYRGAVYLGLLYGMKKLMGFSLVKERKAYLGVRGWKKSLIKTYLDPID